MASRRQRFRKLMRRRQDQSMHVERTHVEAYDHRTGRRLHHGEEINTKDTVIERAGGPQPHKSTHRPKRHPRHEAAVLLHDALRQAGVSSEDSRVTAPMVDKFLQLLEHVGSPDVAVTQLVDQLLKQRDDQIAEGARRLQAVDWGADEDSAVVDLPTKLSDLQSCEELPLTECALNGLRLADGSPARHPTEEEWTDLVAEARRRKRGLTNIARGRVPERAHDVTAISHDVQHPDPHEGTNETVVQHDVLCVEVANFEDVVLNATSYGTVYVRDKDYEGEVPL